MTSKKTKVVSIQSLAMDFFNNRDEISFTKMYNRLKPGMHHYIRKSFGCDDPQIRDFIIANTFTNIWTKIGTYDPYYAFSTWAYRIARNEALQSKRYRSKNSSLDAMQEIGARISTSDDSVLFTPDYEYFEPTHEECMDKLHHFILTEIENLPSVYRTVLLESIIKKKKETQIASEYGWNLNTVKTRKLKAKKMIQNIMNEKYPMLVKKYYTE